MNRSIPILVILLCCATFAFASTINHSVEFDDADFKFEEEGDYDVFWHSECRPYREDLGAPQILASYYHFIIDDDQIVDSVKIDSTVIDSFPSKYFLIPVQEDAYYVDPFDSNSYTWQDIDSSLFQTISSYPDTIALVSLYKTGLFDGANHIATIEVLPTSWRLSDSTLFYYSYLEFTVYLSITGSPQTDPIEVEIRMRDDQDIYEKIVANLVENPEDYVEPNALSDTSICLEDQEGVLVYPYVIITRESFEGLWDPFVEWLNRKGKRAGVVTMETIDNYSAADFPKIESDLSDDANWLRSYLKYAYIHGTVWVLLGGSSYSEVHVDIDSDDNIVPIRYAKMDYFSGDPPTMFNCQGENVPGDWDWAEADIYFSELNTNWESDSDGHPGEQHDEYGDDIENELDPFQELFVGRLPVIDSVDIKNWIEKILNYEQNPGDGDSDYLLTSFFTLADLWMAWGVYDATLEHFTGEWEHHKLEEDTWNGSPSTEPTGEEVLDSMNVYPGFIHWNNHGLIRSIALATNSGGSGPVCYRLNSYDGDGLSCIGWTCSGVDVCSVDSLKNINKPGFLFPLSCHVSRYSCVYEEYENHNISAKYVLMSNGGVGCVGATGATGIHPSPGHTTWGKFLFMDWIFHNDIDEDPLNDPDRHRKTGPAMAYMNPQMGFWNNVILNLFGSPEQLIWNDEPAHFDVSVYFANDSVVVKDASSGSRIEGAFVCFSSRDLSDYYQKRTDANGKVTVPGTLNFDITDATYITVTRHNYIPYQILGSGNTDEYGVWRGDIAFYDDITIPASDTLIIKPGSNIYIHRDKELTVNGTLIAEGTSCNHIVFNELPGASGEWDWIKFGAKSVGILDYCDFRNAYIGLNIQDTSDVSVENCSFDSMDVGGIYISRSEVYVYNSSFENIDNYGINSSYSELTVDKCDFLRCDDYGIQCLYDGTANFDSTKITNCNINLYEGGGGGPSGSQYGIYAAYLDTSRIQNNVINRYEQGGIKLNHSDTYVKGDTISNSTYYGIYAYNNTDAEMDSCVFNTVATGIYITGTSDPDVKGMWFEASIDTGVYINGPCQPDLGNAPSDSGFSDYEVCDDYYIYQYNMGSMISIKAEGNWFGRSVSTSKFYGLIDYIPYRTSDPFSKAAFNGEIPYTYELKTNFPNPFNPTTTFRFSLAEPGYTTLTIYNILGQRVARPVDAYKQPGHHSVIWNGRNASGDQVSSGIYFYRIESGSFTDTKKMTILR